MHRCMHCIIEIIVVDKHMIFWGRGKLCIVIYWEGEALGPVLGLKQPSKVQKYT